MGRLKITRNEQQLNFPAGKRINAAQWNDAQSNSISSCRVEAAYYRCTMLRAVRVVSSGNIHREYIRRRIIKIALNA
jgi:hypothetical protein